MLRELITNEWITILFIVSLATLTIAKYTYATRFSEFLMVIGNSRYLKVYVREQKFIDLFEGLLFINFIISASIFYFICYNTFVAPLEFSILWFGKVFLAIGTILLIKVLLERLIASVFNIDALIDSYLFQKTNYKNYLGLILLPINLILIYSITATPLLLYIVILVLAIVNLIGFFTSVKTYQKSILDNLFYFILYLCALEFGPYIILYNLLTNN